MGAGALDKLMKPRPFEEVYVAVLLREILKAREAMWAFLSSSHVLAGAGVHARSGQDSPRRECAAVNGQRSTVSSADVTRLAVGAPGRP